MKKFIALAAAALRVMPVVGKDKDKEKKADKDSLIFTTIVENPVTSIKNQNSSAPTVCAAVAACRKALL